MESAAAIRPSIVVVRASERRHDRHQPLRTMDRGPELCRAGVREAVHSHTTVAARQARRPHRRIVAVVLFVLERIPLALGYPTPATVLDDHHIPVAGVPRWVGVG